MSREALLAALPAAASSLYLRKIEQESFDLLRDPAEVFQFRRQLTMLRALVTGKL